MKTERLPKEHIILTLNNTEDINEEIILQTNKSAMDYLAFGRIDLAQKLLKRVENLLGNYEGDLDKEKIKSLLSLTLNNLGCLYKKVKKPNVALSYLTKAAILEEELGIRDENNYAMTLLNICAILSHLKKHKIAIEYATKAKDVLLSLLKSSIGDLELQSITPMSTHAENTQRSQRLGSKTSDKKLAILNYNVEDPLNTNILQTNKSLELNKIIQEIDTKTQSKSQIILLNNEEFKEEKTTNLNMQKNSSEVLIEEKNYPDNINKENIYTKLSSLQRTYSPSKVYPTLTIAYYNLGVEHEYIKKYKSAINNYTRGIQVSTVIFGEKNSMTRALRKSLRETKIKLQGEEAYHILRGEERTRGTLAKYILEDKGVVEERDMRFSAAHIKRNFILGVGVMDAGKDKGKWKGKPMGSMIPVRPVTAGGRPPQPVKVMSRTFHVDNYDQFIKLYSPLGTRREQLPIKSSRPPRTTRLIRHSPQIKLSDYQESYDIHNIYPPAASSCRQSLSKRGKRSASVAAIRPSQSMRSSYMASVQKFFDAKPPTETKPTASSFYSRKIRSKKGKQESKGAQSARKTRHISNLGSMDYHNEYKYQANNKSTEILPGGLLRHNSAMVESSLNKINLQLKNLENKLFEYDNVIRSKEMSKQANSRRADSRFSNLSNLGEELFEQNNSFADKLERIDNDGELIT